MPQQQMTEEQMKELQEKIKNMSPEELREFQKKQCVFCHIISGRVQSKKVYEDDRCLAVLDINTANPGHVLLLPKEHYSIMPQLSEEEIAHLFVVAKTISNAVLRGLGIQGTNIIVQNGIAAGQKAQHFMIHIIPRKEGDGVNFELPKKEMPEAELESIRKRLEAKLGAVKETEPKQKEGPGIEKVQELIKPKKEEKVVEAEFKEEERKEPETMGKKAAEKNSRQSPGSLPIKFDKKPKRGREKESKEPEKEDKKEAKEDVGLDDIARVLGVK